MKKLSPFAYFLIFLSLIIGLSLVSYNFNDIFYPHNHVKNFIGMLGAYLSYFLLNRFGALGYTIPFFLSLSIFSLNRGVPKFVRSTLFWFLFIFSFDIVLYAIFGVKRSFLLHHGYFICGSIGYMLGSSVEFIFGKIGAFLILLPFSAIILYFSQKEIFQFLLTVPSNKQPKDNKQEMQPKAKKKERQGQKKTDSEDRNITEKEKEEKTEIHIDTEYLDKKQETIELKHKEENGYKFPSADLLDDPVTIGDPQLDNEEIQSSARKLEEKLKHFGVEGKIVGVKPGPVVTMYEFRPKSGIKISKIANLYNDLALAMEAMSVRIIAPIPGKAVIGIEVSNKNRQTVFMKEVVSSRAFIRSSSKLSLGLGKDIVGNIFVADLTRMPHLLIAGATGSGKSVSLNTMIVSILYKAAPQEVKFVMIDPKILELSTYDGIPHMMMPVVTDPKEAAASLNALINEMETRYKIMNEAGVRNIEGFNAKAKRGSIDYPPMPYIVVVIDELSDLMMVSGKKVEMYVERLAQKSRAAGIHLIVATQRPSVDVVTGLIKANFPARISFKVSSKVDSRTILDTPGAEALLGRGDMLLMQPGSSSLTRIHGAYISEDEIKRITEFVKTQGTPEYNEELIETTKELAGTEETEEELDPLFDEAVQIIKEGGNPSISYLQRRLKIGYNKAARIVEQMEKKGILSKPDHRGKREILI